MQATGGAIDLAFEETDISDEVISYLNICRQENRRVVKLLERMRQIYRPQGKEPESIQLDNLLQDVLKMTSEEMSIHNIILDGEIATALPAIKGVPEQLYLAFLSILLNLCEVIGSAGGGTLRYQCHDQEQFIQIEFLAIAAKPSPDRGPEEPANIIFVEPARNMIIANHGDIKTGIENREIFIRIWFPIIPN